MSRPSYRYYEMQIGQLERRLKKSEEMHDRDIKKYFSKYYMKSYKLSVRFRAMRKKINIYFYIILSQSLIILTLLILLYGN